MAASFGHASYLCAVWGILASLAFSQPWTQAYISPTAIGDCAGLSANLNNEFSVEPVVSNALFGEVAPRRIVKMAFFLQPGAHYSDLYIAEKGDGPSKARVLYYNGVTKSLKVIGTLPNAHYGSGGSLEHGLLGIALNPRTFAQDHFLYLFYSVGPGTFGSAKLGLRISRFTLNPVTQEIDFWTEKVLLFVPVGNQLHYFTGSGLHFDQAGNLYISVGSNEALAIGPGNTADLRGSILRIKPDTANPKGYVVPAGNFGEYWAQQFESQGRSPLAAKYRDTAKVKAEIYIKGVRNVYSFSVDPTRPGTVEWSQCGPDVDRGETHSLTTQPAFGGWPFWLHGSSEVVRVARKDPYGIEAGDPSSTDWTAFNPPDMSPGAPVNNWPGIQGVDSLPPYHIPFFGHTHGCAVGGPIVRYSGDVANPGKMPPHLDNTVMVSDFDVGSGLNSIWAAKVNPTTGPFADMPTQVFTMPRSGRPSLYNSVDFQQGLDGALYMIDWGAGGITYNPPSAKSGIVRLSYTGTCQDPGLTPVRTTPGVLHRSPVPWFRIQSGRIILSDIGDGLMPKGRHTLKIMDIQGKVLHAYAGTGGKEYPMPELAAGRLYILRAETPLGIAQMTYGSL